MNISQEKIDDLNAVIRIKLNPEDYRPKYEASIRDYSKKANIKGFRPGHVPIAMVKKMYGKSILAEEVNKLINDTLYKFISDNNLEVLGNPLPAEDQQQMEFHENAEMSFAYEIGLAPKIDLNLSGEMIHYHKLKVDDELVNKQIEDMSRRYGKLEDAEISEEKDMLKGTFDELTESGEVKEGGISSHSTISIEFLEDAEMKKELVGLKQGAHITVDPKRVSGGAADLASMLNISKEEAENINSKFRFTVEEIKRLHPAEFNQEFFDKLFGEDKVHSEEELRAKIREDLANMFEFDADRLFFREVTSHLLNKLHIALPDEFLKRWIIATNEKPVSREDLDKEYPGYAKGLKWQLIENKIIRDNEIKVDHAEALEYTKNYLNHQYQRYGLPPLEDERVTEGAMRILTNKEESKKIYDELYNRKVMGWLKSAVTLDPHEVPYEQFIKMLNSQSHDHHGHDHDHDHNHDHDHDHDHEHEHHHH
jgi:trigger factor